MMLMERGEIIISEVSHEKSDKGLAKFITPAHVVVERGPHGVLGFMLMPWLPTELMRNTEIEIATHLVTGAMAASVEMVSFYKAWAETERDKIKSFGKDFTAQIEAIEKYHVERYAASKHRQKKDIFVNPSQISPSIIALFEEEDTWGDSSVSH
jgi:hypothetical protein